MDLRWRLFGYVLGFALALLLAAAAWVGLALREDVAEEMAASTRLVNTMLAVSAAPESRAGVFRHCDHIPKLAHPARPSAGRLAVYSRDLQCSSPPVSS